MSDLETGLSDDLWAEAMAEQSAAESAQTKPAQFQTFDSPPPSASMIDQLDRILDIPVTITVELGRTKIRIQNLLQLNHGSVVELEGQAGEPLNIFVNNTLIAQGEVVVINDKYGIRLTDIISPAERARKLGGR